MLKLEGYSNIRPVYVAKNIITKNGIKGLYKGLDAALIRQMTYSSLRLGLFRIMCDYYEQKKLKDNVSYLSLNLKIRLALISSFFASLISSPLDMTLIRLQTSLLFSIPQQNNNFYQLIRHIIKNEGFISLWKGGSSNIIRVILLNVSMLTSYHHFNDLMNKKLEIKNNDLKIKLLSSLFSGFFASSISLPFYVIRTQIQKEHLKSILTLNTSSHTRYLKVMLNIYKKGGLKNFFVGYSSYYLRVAPHTMITLLCLDWLDRIF